MALLPRLTRQATHYWTSGTGLTNDSAETIGSATFANLQAFAQRSAELCEVEGFWPSTVTPGLRLPARGPTTMDVVTAATIHHINGYPRIPTTTLWSVSEAEAAAAASPCKPSSVAVVPEVPEALMEAVFAELPAELHPRYDDTKSTLKARLSTCNWLDDAHVPAKGAGKGGATVRLNDTTHRMPRRSSQSVRGSPSRTCQATGCTTRQMYNYTGFRRPSRDLSAFAMAPRTFDLGTLLWLAVRDHLSEESRSAPFNHVQWLLYYTVLDSHMRQHRDNSNVRDFVQAVDALQSVGHVAPPSKGNCVGIESMNSQVPNSSVVVFSLGCACMTLRLRYADKADCWQDRKRYVVHPKFTMRLGPGTAFVLDPMDDIFFTHEACFEVWDQDEAGWRVALVFRHCESLLEFESDGLCKMHVEQAEEALRKKERKRKKARQAARQRNQLMRSMI
jgi:hypothetical protein